MKAINQASVEIAGGCNYRCISCPQSSGREKQFLRMMPVDVFRRVIRDLKDHGCESVSLQGSGEPLLHPKIVDLVSFCSSLGISTSIISNGSLLTPSLALSLAKSGLSSIRISLLGVTEDDYKLHMGTDNSLARIVEKIKESIECIRAENCDVEVTLSGLILPSSLDEDEQLQKYKTIAQDAGDVPLEIWKPHNWAGSADSSIAQRVGNGKQRSCGRPQANYLTIRAGGLDNHRAAVVPCCFVLGNDSSAVLGHLDTQSIDDVLSGNPYKELLQAHENNNYENHSYCSKCDQLYSCPDSLVFSNISYRKYGFRQQSSSSSSTGLSN